MKDRDLEIDESLERVVYDFVRNDGTGIESRVIFTKDNEGKYFKHTYSDSTKEVAEIKEIKVIQSIEKLIEQGYEEIDRDKEEVVKEFVDGKTVDELKEEKIANSAFINDFAAFARSVKDKK